MFFTIEKNWDGLPFFSKETIYHVTEFSSTTVMLGQYIQCTCFWFLVFDNYSYSGLYLYAEIHFLLLMFLKEHPIMFLSKIIISTRHVGAPATYREVI